MLAPETVLQSRYRIVRQLGQGGMGAVYEAIDERLDASPNTPAHPNLPDINIHEPPEMRRRGKGAGAIRTLPDGTQVITAPDGTRILVLPNGTRRVLSPGPRPLRRRGVR